MRPRPRPRPITVTPRPRPRPKKWSRDHVGLETLTSLARTCPCIRSFRTVYTFKWHLQTHLFRPDATSASASSQIAATGFNMFKNWFWSWDCPRPSRARLVTWSAILCNLAVRLVVHLHMSQPGRKACVTGH